MRKIAFVLTLLALVAAMVAPALAQDRPSIPEVLEADGRFGTLLAAVGAAGLGDALSGEGPFTLFAPTDDAIAASLTTLGLSAEDLLGNADLLTAVLTYHVVPGRYQFRDLTRGAELTTLEGSTISVTLADGVFAVNGLTILDVDNLASNGVVHVIEDGVLLPESASAAPAAETTEPTPVPGVAQARPSIPEVLEADGRFGTLLAAVGAAGLGDALAGEGPFTLFAPTDDAIAASLTTLGLSAEDLLGNADLLTAVLTYHVVPGRYQFRDLTGGGELTTLEGSTVSVTLADGVFAVNGLTILDVDNLASNGVVHVIEDGVLLPESAGVEAAPVAETVEPTPVPGVAQARPSIPEVLEADGRFGTLLAAVGAAGLGDALAGEGPFTLFAPTDDAIAASLTSLGLSAEDLIGNADLLTAVLTYHVVPGRYQFRDLTGGGELTTLEGSTVSVTLADGVFAVNGLTILDVDNLASNGVVHVIEDGVLLPESAGVEPAPVAETVEPTPAPAVVQERPSIPEILEADGRFGTLLAAVGAAGLGDALAGEGPFTLFAPTDDAIAATLGFVGLSAEDLLASPDLLTSILTYHVVQGRYQFRDLTGGAELTTLEGGTLSVTLVDGVFAVNNLGILDVDNLASNGVVHVIEDGVLLPASAGLVANVRVAHFSPDAPAVDIWVNGARAIENLAFGAITEWVALPVGVYDLAVSVAGTDNVVLAFDNQALAPGLWATIAARGSVEAGTLEAQIIPEDYASVTDAAAQVTVYHVIEGAPAVNITANGAVVVSALAYPGTVNDNDGVFTLSVPAGTYDLAVVAGGAALLEAPATELSAGVSYFIAAIGTPDAPQLAVAATSVVE